HSLCGIADGDVVERDLAIIIRLDDECCNHIVRAEYTGSGKRDVVFTSGCFHPGILRTRAYTNFDDARAVRCLKSHTESAVQHCVECDRDLDMMTAEKLS